MSDAQPNSKGATFTYVLGAFAGFAVLLSVIQTFFGRTEIEDPRAKERAANTEEINKAQGELVAKMGLNDKAKAAALFAKTAEALKAKAPAPSKMAVPPAVVPAPAAPAPAAPAAPAAPGAAPAAPPPAK